VTAMSVITTVQITSSRRMLFIELISRPELDKVGHQP
jgi:hypothetical protein